MTKRLKPKKNSDHPSALQSSVTTADEAVQIVAAIRKGEVDALVVGTPPNEKIYTLESADQAYRIFVDNMAGGATTFAVDGTILYANKRFAEIVEEPLELIVGSSIANYLAPEDRDSFVRLQSETGAGKSKGELKLLPRTDRTPRVCHVALATLPTDGAHVFCGIFTEITALVKAEEELRHAHSELELRVEERTRELAASLESLRESERERTIALKKAEEARAEAEASNGAKDRFLATLSHELRTPLNAIFGWTQLMRKSLSDGGPGDIFSEGLTVIERSTRVQVQLMEDLLDVSRVISGKMEIDLELVDLEKIVDTAIENLRPSAEAAGISLEQEIEALSRPVRGDAMRLQQVVSNLLGNAIKFTPATGKVKLRLAEVNGAAEITVIDTGKGIAREFLGHLFERFAQADAGTTRKHRGLGLGLAIVRSLVALHGGTVQAHSDGEGKGATFTVRVPLWRTSQSKISAARALADLSELVPNPERSNVLNGVHVMVVDDDLESRELLTAILKHCEARVTQSADARDAFQAVQADTPDVLLCDIAMPEEDGISFIRRLRELSSATVAGVPAIAVTASASLQERAIALESGFQEHISKPFDYDELVSTVARLAHRRRHGRS